MAALQPKLCLQSKQFGLTENAGYENNGHEIDQDTGHEIDGYA